jgi:hypothetical protein
MCFYYCSRTVDIVQTGVFLTGSHHMEHGFTLMNLIEFTTMIFQLLINKLQQSKIQLKQI